MVSRLTKKERKNKLINVLKKKLIAKYGTNDGPQCKFNIQLEEIVDSVSGLVKGDLQRSHLAEIENRAKAACSGFMKGKPNGLASHQRQNMAAGKKLVCPASLKNDWVIMDFFEAIENDKSIKADQKKLHDEKVSIRRTLDEQCAAKEKIRLEEKKKEDAYLREQNSIMEQWNYEQQIAHSMGHKKMIAEKAIRDQQCRLNALKKKKIRDKEDAEARQDILICQQELERQEQQRIGRINDQKARNVENMAAVMKQFGKKEKEEREQKAEDFRLMCQKRDMMLAEEKSRKDAFNERVAKYEKYSSKWQESGAGAAQREEELKMERKILREAAAHDAAKDKREVDDAKKQKDMAIFLQAENLKMAAKRRAEESAQAIIDKKYSSGIRKAGEAYAAGAWEREIEEREKGKKYARELKLQKMEIDRRVTKVEMGPVERTMNRKLLMRLQKDKNIIKDIQKKMFDKRQMTKSEILKYSSNLPGFTRPGEANPDY